MSIEEQLRERHERYMPASLLDSRFTTLDPPRGEGDVIEFDADSDLATTVPQRAARLRAEVATGGRQS